MTNLRREVLRLRKKGRSFKARLENAGKIANERAFLKMTDKMTLSAKIFTSMQFRETQKKPRGRRFHMEEKILSMSLFKRSPKCYSLLSKCFTLPSTKTLKNLLGKIKIGPGINKLVFERMKKTVGDISSEDRLCTLIFDEMSLSPQLHYDSIQDKIRGFTTNGQNKISDHALVFMVKGIKKNYKQPVAYYFTQNLNKVLLKTCIKEVVRHVHASGLTILCSVCDQSAVNVGAIDSLVRDTKEIYLKKGKAWRDDMFTVDNKTIIPLYDVPHLLKGIRNNLLTKDLKYVDFEDDNKEKVLKWEYFQQLYEADKSYGELKYLQKITEEHVNPEKINKMKVKTAAQIFSHSVAVSAEHLAASGKLDPVCRQITPFALLFDKLFDSLNSCTFQIVDGKIYRAGVKRNSPHHKLWQYAIKFLKNMRFIMKKKVGANLVFLDTVVPSIKNFIKTIEGMQAIWKLLNNKYGLDTMLCRNFNQDPVENFFGSIRSQGARNVSPNSIGFEGAYKALLLQNYCSSHSLKSNCEDDMSTFLQSLDFFIKEQHNCSAGENDESMPDKICVNEEILVDKHDIENAGLYQRSYVCGWVLKKCLKKIIVM